MHQIFFLKFFHRYLGSKLSFVFILNLLVYLLDSFGLVLIIPIISSVLNEGTLIENSWIDRLIEELLKAVGLEQNIYFLLIIFLIIFSLKALVYFLSLRYLAKANGELSVKMKKEIFKNFSIKKYGQFLKRDFRFYINLCTEQAERVTTCFNTFIGFVSAFISVCVYSLIAFALDWSNTIIIGGVAGLVFLIFLKLNDSVKKLSFNWSRQNARLASSWTEFFENYAYIKAVGEFNFAEKRVVRNVVSLADSWVDMNIKSAITSSLKEPLALSLISLLIVLSVDSPGAMGEFVILLALLYRSFNAVMAVQIKYQKFSEFSGSILTIEEQLLSSGVEDKLKTCEFLHPPDPTVTSGLGVSVEVQNLSFGYDDSSGNVIRDFDARFEPGEISVIAGPSGSGKSTLLLILLGLLKPNKGTVRIGVNNLGDSLACQKASVGFVVQEPVIFNGSILENVLMGSSQNLSSMDRDRAIELLLRVGLDPFRRVAPDSFSDKLALSGGEKQRLSLCREIYKTPRLLLLDEFTSALDVESEKAVLKIVRELKNTTIVMVAHKYSVVEIADVVIFLDSSGQILSEGSPRALMSNSEDFLSIMARCKG